tara:strand:+ start:849 stop:1460 length:612 start_codon:yes stop_codon:yes gene_type:complete
MIALTINTDPTSIALTIFNSIIDNAHEICLKSDNCITEKTAICEFTPERALQSLFYSSIQEPDNAVLKIERQIASDVYMLFIIANDLEEQDCEFEVSYCEDLKPFLMLMLWVGILSLLSKHKATFTHNHPYCTYEYTNRYIANIKKTINLLAENVVSKINDTLDRNFTANCLMDNSIFNDSEITDVILLERNFIPMQTLIKDI